jgi:hypothetical protein
MDIGHMDWPIRSGTMLPAKMLGALVTGEDNIRCKGYLSSCIIWQDLEDILRLDLSGK